MPLSWQENKSSPSPCWFMDRGRQYKHPAVVFASKDKGQEFKWRKLHIKLDSQGSGTCFMFFYNSNSSQRFLWHQSMCFTVVCFSMVSLVNWRWFFPGPPRDGLLTLLLRLRLLSIGFLFFNERRNSHIGVSMSFFRFSHWERLRFGGNFFRGWNCSVQVCVCIFVFEDEHLNQNLIKEKYSVSGSFCFLFPSWEFVGFCKCWRDMKFRRSRRWIIIAREFLDSVGHLQQGDTPEI